MSNVYQRLVLHSSFKLNEDIEIFEKERIIADNILKENGIEYAILVQEERSLNQKGRIMPVEYVLSVFVKMQDVDKVIELFDKDGTLGYYVDLEDKIVVDGPLTEEAIKKAAEESEQEEFEIAMEKEPIQNFEEKSSRKIKEPEINDNEYDTIEIIRTKLFVRGAFGVMFVMVILIELSSLLTNLRKSQYDVALKIILLIIIEIPIFVKILKKFKTKKGK